MSIFSIFIFFIFLFPMQLLAVGTHDDDCTPTRCRKGGPKIQFPFRDKNKQSKHCGYPGFDVYCDETSHHTVLLLPSSVNITVKKIDYVSQQLQLYDPKTCVARTNLSASPFNFLSDSLSDYILFNCSASQGNFDASVPCLGDKVYAVENSSNMESLPLTSCTRFRNYPSVPYDIFYGNDLHLQWSKPACGIIVGLQCIQWSPTDRPSMKEVVQMLEGEEADLKMPPNPFPDTNATKFVAGIPERHYKIELPLILEIE